MKKLAHHSIAVQASRARLAFGTYNQKERWERREKKDITGLTASFAELLRQVGFHIRGWRADCIHCEGHSRLTVSFTNEVAYCHRCQWTANVRTLSRELGLRLAPLTREVREKHERNERFTGWVNTCNTILVRRLRHLTRRAELAKNVLAILPDFEPAWTALADFYHAEAELCGALDVLAFEKMSPWLERPMKRETLAAAFDEACARLGITHAN